jgi:hypothetical protein
MRSGGNDAALVAGAQWELDRIVAELRQSRGRSRNHDNGHREVFEMP